MVGVMRRELRRSIRWSMGRYLAILAIIALGSGFLAGLNVTKSAMLATAQDYIDGQAMFDFRIMNTYGYTQADVEALGLVEGIRAAEGVITLDVLLQAPDSEDEVAVRLMSLPETVSLPKLQSGRMPQRAGECLADGYYYTDEDIGTTLHLAGSNDSDTLEQLTVEELTIVGLCSSPMYMNFERGSTTVGKGSLATFLYVPETTFDLDGVYTEIQLKLDQDYTMYSPAYEQALEEKTDVLEPLAEALAQARYDTVLQEARDALADGQAEYDQGLAEYRQERADALAQLDDAQAELDEAQAELDSQTETLESSEAALAAAQAQIDAGKEKLAQGRVQLLEEKSATYQTLADNQAQLTEQRTQATQGLQQVEDGLQQVEDGLTQVEDGLAQIEDGLAQLEQGLSLAQLGLEAAQNLLAAVESGLAENPEDESLLAAKTELETQIANLESQIGDLEAQKSQALAQQAELETTQAELTGQKTQLEATQAELNAGLTQIEDGLAQLESARLQAEDEFAAAEATLEANQLTLENSQAELDSNRATLESGRQELESGRQELADAQAQFDQEKADALAQLDDAQAELDAAKAELEEGEAELADMEPADAYVLDRSTNVAYACLESDADIVTGVSRVFPVFFFAVAALVCLTTMSKMVDEERTQIGVLKALGYGPGTISAKYLFYSGSAALVGCLVGVSLGMVLLPMVIWQGYSIMYNFSSTVHLVFDWRLSLLIVASFTLVMLAVTWLCCNKSLREVPAELIRPKSPKAGKRLLLERLPLWKHLGFLRKVAVRNIFRYKKRLVMMLVGVGGCTALVVTGFGVQDTITNIAQIQYSEVTVYDMAVTFGEPQSQQDQAQFQAAIPDATTLFLHESSVDLTANGGIKSVYLLATEDSLEGYVQLRSGDDPVPFPGVGETVINNGLAKNLELSVGDTVTLRTPDMEELTLTVSGIFDNNVYHYAVVSQETVRQQWGHGAEVNTAYVNAAEGTDVHQVSATVSGQKDVLNVTVSEDMATRVGNMLDSMDYIVATIILCAAALAFIVVYNLTNINITERIREIATLKVLGFYPRETAAYVFREGFALTGMGCVLGLAAGKLLHAFVISQIRVDMVYFNPRITWPSYLYSVILTFLFAALVDLLLYFKLERINMAEALKSVE